MGSLLVKLMQLALSGKKGGWLVSTLAVVGFRLVSKLFSKKELVDLSKSKPGDRFIVEHLDTTHGEQIKASKAKKKADRKNR